MRRRRGFTFVEALVGSIIVLMVVGGAWVIFVGASRGGKRVLEYSSALEAAASIQARLMLDLSSAYVPRGMSLASGSFRIEEEGRKATFLAGVRERDPESVSPDEHRRVEVVWQAVPDGDGGFVIERQPAQGEGQRWEGVSCRAASFRVLHHETSLFFVADLLFRGSTSASVKDPKDVPVRVTWRLRPVGRIPDGVMPYPAAIMGDLPSESSTPARSLLTEAQRRIQLTREGS